MTPKTIKKTPALKEAFQAVAGSAFIIFGGNGFDGVEIAGSLYDRARNALKSTI